MKKEDIHFGDWQRVFWGDVPLGFYWEVVLRITIIYFFLMVAMRLMGKRMATQLSRNEMIAMVSLAAAIGISLQSADRGILAIFVVGAVVIAAQQSLARLSTKSERLESFTQGNMTVIIHDSKLDLSNMQKTGVTTERIFAQLRSMSVTHLGEVRRLYFEANGTFSIILNDEIQPGLSVLPDTDNEFIQQTCVVTNETVCGMCGNMIKESQETTKCNNCGFDKPAKAILNKF